MTVEAQISEADVIRVSTGLPIYFTILGAPEQRYEARLRAIEPAPDSINDDTSSSTTTAVYYNGLFEVSNPEGALRIGMTAQVHLVLATERNALVIPAIALSGDRVQVVDGAGKLQWRQVKVGLNNKVDALDPERPRGRGIRGGEPVDGPEPAERAHGPAHGDVIADPATVATERDPTSLR